MPNDFLVSLFEHKAWCNARLIEALKAAPAEADRRRLAVAIYTLDHTSIVDRLFQARLTGRPETHTEIVAGEFPHLDALGQRLAETDAWYLDYARDVSPAELGEVIEFTFVADGEPGRMTKGEILAHVITHGANHRGGIGNMLETLNVPGAPDMVTSYLSALRSESVG